MEGRYSFMTRLPVVSSDNNTWGTTLNAFLAVAHNADGSLKNYYYNVKDPAYGAIVDGSTDDTTAIRAALNAASTAGGGTVFLSGLAAVSGSITVPNNVTFLGSGQNSGLKILAGFSGAQVLLLNGDFAQVRDMQIVGPTSTYSGNPAANAIQITGARRCIVDKVVFYYINGWMVQSTSTSGVANYNCRFTNLYGFNCAKGIHTLGVSGSSYGMSAFIHQCGMDFSTGSGDCYLIEDSNDVLMSDIYGDYLGGSGNVFRIHGACNGVYMSNFDIGPFPGPIGNVVVIESGANGSPNYIGLSNGIIEGGSIGLLMSAGQQVSLANIEFFNNNTAGLQITGGFAYLVSDCFFYLNGSSAGSGRYDIVSSTSGNGEIRGCHFLTPQGSGAQQTNNAVNVTAGTVVMSDCTFYGTGYNSGNIFNNKPAVIRNCPGYNPLGIITPPSVPASTVATTALPTDCTVYIKGGTLTNVQVNGVTTGISAAAPAGAVHTVRVPAQLTIAVTYTVTPSWVWSSD